MVGPIYLPQEKIDAIRGYVENVAFTPEEMKDPDKSWYETWNAAVNAVNEVLDIAMIAREEPVC